MRVLFLKLFYPLLALSSFINPFYGVLNYAFITIIRPESLTWGGALIAKVSLLAISSLTLSSFFKGKINTSLFKNKFFIFFLLFYLFLLISTHTSWYTYITPKQSQITFSYMQQILIIFVYCLCLYGVIEHDVVKLEILLNFIVSCFVFMALWGVNQRFCGNILVEGLFGSAIKDRCAITGIFILFFPLTLFCFIYPYKNKLLCKFIGGTGIISFPLIVFFTDSRAGFLGFMVCLLLLGLMMKNKIRNFLYIIILMVLIYPILPPEYQERVSSIGKASEETGEIDHSSGSRLVMWKAGLMIFSENKFLGVGNLNFPEAAYSMKDHFLGKISFQLHSYTFQENFKLQCHNMFINILAEGGLLSSIPFFMMIIIPFWRTFKLRSLGNDPDFPKSFMLSRLLRFLCAGMVGYLVTCCFANMRLIDFYYWQLTIMLITGEILVKQVAKERKGENEEDVIGPEIAPAYLNN